MCTYAISTILYQKSWMYPSLFQKYCVGYIQDAFQSESEKILIFNLYWSVKAAVLQMLKKYKKNKINGKYWSSYVPWRSLLLLTP